MIDDLKPYPEYKASGAFWLGTVPAGWCIQRLKSVVSNVVEQTATMYPSEVYVALEHVESWTGRVRVVRGEASFTGQVKRFRSGDVLFGKLRPYLAKVACLSQPGVCAGEFFVLRSRSAQVTQQFLQHLLLCKPAIDVVDGATFGAKMPRADWQFVGNLRVALPSISEQTAIVRFLGFAVGKIEQAIRAKRKMISLLNEQKQLIIHHAVSRGLDQDVKLKPSGIPWLGEVPEHWITVSLRQRYHQCLGKMVDAKKATGKHLIPYLRNIDVRWGHINTTALPLIDIAPHERERYTVKLGDLLVCEGRHLGRSAIWKGGVEVCGFQKALHRLRPISREVDDPRFLQYVMVVANATDAFHRNKIDNAIPHLTGEMLRAHRFAFPPIHEQREIATYLESHLQQHERAIARAEREIALLREYRMTLTADVVTGKLDVREAVKSLPISAEQPTAPDGADVPDDTDDELTEFAE